MAQRMTMRMESSSSSATSTMGVSSSITKGEVEAFGPSRRIVHVRQTSLTKALDGSIQMRSHIQMLLYEAKSEIAHTITKFNLTFNVLKDKQWKKMVVAIAKADYQVGWTSLSYDKIHGKKIVEEKTLIHR